MAEIVRMPKLSDTMTEGVVAEWHKKVGDQVESGELLAEIETDKATMEFESFQEGVLLHIGVEKGAAAPVDSILAILGEEGEDVSALLNEAAAAAPAKEEAPKAAAPAPAKEEAPKAASAPAASTPAPVAMPAANGERVKASPLAKKMAADKGINLATVAGSGEHGRIVRRDVEFYQPATVVSGASALQTEQFEEVAVSQMRKAIAKSLSNSKFSAPHYYLMCEVEMSNAIASRKAINAMPDTKVSFNDMVIKATAMALKKHPAVNASWQETTVRINHHVNIGVAVAVEDGLLVPVVRYADTKTMSQISAEVKEYAGKARDKKLQPSDWEGSTFTISNLGMFGISEFTSIINQPDSAILSVGAIIEKPVVKDGQIVVGNVMKLSLACDHRTIDGATGAQFLQTLKAYLENPVAMLA